MTFDDKGSEGSGAGANDERASASAQDGTSDMPDRRHGDRRAGSVDLYVRIEQKRAALEGERRASQRRSGDARTGTAPTRRLHQASAATIRPILILC